MEEPKRLSAYDVLENNLKLANRITFIHRIFYIAEHFDNSEESHRLVRIIETIIKKVNEECSDERLTGLLVFYKNYLIHVLDGSEESIMNHFIILFKDANELLGKAKLLVTCHHINQRFFDIWDYRISKPPILFEKLNPNCEFEETKRYIEICIKKVYNLVSNLRLPAPNNEGPTKIGEITSDLTEFLPESAYLSFLLDSKLLRDVRKFSAAYNDIPRCRFYTECIWPVRGDFVPYNVFDEERNPVQQLKPKE